MIWKVVIAAFIIWHAPPPGHQTIPLPGITFIAIGDTAFTSEKSCETWSQGPEGQDLRQRAKADVADYGGELLNAIMVCYTDESGQPT